MGATTVTGRNVSIGATAEGIDIENSILRMGDRPNVSYVVPQMNEEFTLLASAARTIDTASADQTNPAAGGAALTLNITVNASSETITLYLQHKDPVSGNYVNLANSGVLNTSDTGTFTWQPAVPLPNTWRINADKSGAASVTFSVAGAYARSRADAIEKFKAKGYDDIQKY